MQKKRIPVLRSRSLQELVVVAIPPAAQDAETKTVLDSVAANINVEVQQQAEADFDALKLALSDSMCAG